MMRRVCTSLNQFVRQLLGIAGIALLACAPAARADTLLPSDLSADSGVLLVDTLASPESEQLKSDLTQTDTMPVGPMPPSEFSFPSEREYGDVLIFEEIELSLSGMTGIDTLGDRWRYDFDEQRFYRDLERSEEDREWEIAASVEDRATERKEVTTGQQSLVVGYDEYVEGDVIVLGRATIRGWVQGDVQSLTGRVIVTSTGRIDGDIRAPEIVADSDAIVNGRQIITDSYVFGLERFLPGPFTLLIIATILLTVITFVVSTLMPTAMNNLTNCVRRYPGRTHAVGMLILLTAPILALVALVTIVGVLLVPFIPLLYLFALILGIIVMGRRIGEAILGWILGQSPRPIVAAYFGVSVYLSFWWGTWALQSATGPLGTAFGIASLIVMTTVSIHPLLTGIGASVLTRLFGRRPFVSFTDRQFEDREQVPAPAPPPLPESPPISPRHSVPLSGDEIASARRSGPPDLAPPQQ